MWNAYMVDEERRKDKNAAGENYWDVYFEEIFDSVGIRGERIGSQKGFTYEGRKALFLGECDWDFGDAEFVDWLEEGGTALLFHSPGADKLMGFGECTEMGQTDDCFSISAYLSLTDIWKKDYRNEELKTLPIYSDYSIVQPSEDTEVLALLHRPTIFGLDGGDGLGVPAVCRRQVGKGWVYYFSFRLTQTLCVMRQGRPVDRDYDGDGYYRTADGITLTRGHDLSVPYSDIYCDMVRDIVIKSGQPVIHTMPVTDDGMTVDFLIHYGGDDESSPDYQVQAAKVMKELDLPYHVNLMLNKDGDFAVDLEQFRQLKEDGTTPSIHFDFFRARTFYTQEELNGQLDKYLAAFGEIPKVAVNHVLMATGWAEHARWCRERGIKADNTRVHKHLMPDYNPINTYGMAFGSSLPHYVYEDAAHRNERMEFLYIPIVFFEPRIWPGTEAADKAAIDLMLERSFEYGGALNVFVHPIYLVKEPAVMEALRYIKKRVVEMKYAAEHVNNDFLCDWWYDRSRIGLEPVHCGEKKICFTTKSDRPFALVYGAVSDTYLVNGVEKKALPYVRFGQNRMLYPIDAGENRVEITVQ